MSSVASSRRSAPPLRRARALLVLLALTTAGCQAREVAEARGSIDQPGGRAAVAAAAQPPVARPPVARPPVAAPRPATGDTSFGATIARLSEPGGYFDTDNLVSNETSVLHVLPTLERRGVRGGAYIGVGPEQSFSYIAAVRPAVAYIIDIRRDNLLQHLWYKALFALARDPAEFLLVATGRPEPTALRQRRDRPIDSVVALVDAAPPTERSAAEARRRVLAAVRGFGVPLDSADLATIARIHDAFIAAGLDLRFTSYNRAPREYYPTLRDLVLARDRLGRRNGFLATAGRFEVVKALQAADRVIPVVGDLAGDHALAAIGQDVRRRGLTVSAFYVSNVEYYLVRDGTFARFARTAAALPRDGRSTIIRSCFGFACGPDHPAALPGHRSVQIAQALDDFAAAQAAGELATYDDVVRRHVLP